MKGLWGKKLGMTKLFDESGEAIAVTLLECGPCPVLQVKTVDKNNYNTVQIGFGSIKEKHLSKAIKGHCKKAGVEPVKIMGEVKFDKGTELKAGQVLTAAIFENVKLVDVIGYSKGRGFTGTIKRYNFQRGRETHGNKNHRAPGSVGNHTFPARVWPGKKLPGQHGNARVTIKNLEVIKVEPEKNLLVVRGAVPGFVNGFVMMKESEYGKVKS